MRRFSNARKAIRLTIYLTAFFTVYFVVLKILFPLSDYEAENIIHGSNALDLVSYDTTPITVDQDDGIYVGQAINYKIAREYKSFGSDTVKDESVCLFTQFSADRLDAFIELAASWNSYISAALYVENENHVDYIVEILDAKLNRRLLKDARIDLSLLYSYGKSSTSSASIHPYDLLYPINALRNLALTECKSKYAFSLDVDFRVSQSTHRIINDHLNLLRETEPWALVVPAFEWIFAKEVMPMEFDIKNLRHYCSNGRMIPFHAKRLAGRMFAKADLRNWCYGKSSAPNYLKLTRVQNLTNYTKWLSAKEAYPITKKANVLDSYYEPYFVARKDLIPSFSERFRGYGFNKRVNAMAMQYAGFDFVVLPEAFAVHRYHPKSTWQNKLKHDIVIQKTLGRTFDLYKAELKKNKKVLA